VVVSFIDGGESGKKIQIEEGQMIQWPIEKDKQ